MTATPQNTTYRPPPATIHISDYEPAFDENIFVHKKTREFFEWWQQVRDNKCPYRQQFDIVDHPRWAANALLVRVEAGNPPIYRIRIIGDEIVRLLGHNDTGKTLAETAWDSDGGLTTKAYDTLISNRRPMRFHGTLGGYKKEYLKIESIYAPFLGDDGRVSTVIGLICRLK